jgi:hypothetical protein
MQRTIGLLAIVAFFGLVAAADAQAPPPPSAAGTPFDGTYRLVSAARVNKIYTTRKGQMGQCPARQPGPLSIVQGQAQYTSATGYQVLGTVGPRGELAMRSVAPPTTGGSQPLEISVNGRIDGTGTIHVRQRSNLCSYDFVWRK